MNGAKIQFRNVRKHFPMGGFLHKKHLRAVSDVSFDVKHGEVLAVVGESGCGKTTLARMLMKLHDPTEGEIIVDGRPLSAAMTRSQVKQFHTKVQMIFQDPFAALNPAHTVRGIIGRAITLHNRRLSVASVHARVSELLALVGLTPPEDFMGKHPAQLSGGQRQRIVIARALAVDPEIIVADEPTSMLDVSIGIDIMNLLLELKEKKRLTMMYITHNLAGARYIADHMVVMYAGNAVEYGGIDDIIAAPYHPYTVLLLASTPEPFRGEEITLSASEELPNLLVEQRCCLFANRCPLVKARCSREVPGNYAVGERMVKCFLYADETPPEAPRVDARLYAGDAQRQTKE